MRFAQFIRIYAPLPEIKSFKMKKLKKREGFYRGQKVNYVPNPSDWGYVWRVYPNGDVGVHWHSVGGEDRSSRPAYIREPAHHLSLA